MLYLIIKRALCEACDLNGDVWGKSYGNVSNLYHFFKIVSYFIYTYLY